MSQAGKYILIQPGMTAVTTLTGDVGGAVPADGAGNIDILGGTGIDTTGNPGANSITISVEPTVAIQFFGDAGIATPALNNLNIDGGINISTSAAGNTVTIDAFGFASFQWQVVSATPFNMIANEGYIVDHGATVTLTLPVAGIEGDILRVAGFDGGWIIAQNANQRIHFGNQPTTLGVGGSLASTEDHDCVEMVVASDDGAGNILELVVISAIGNINVV